MSGDSSMRKGTKGQGQTLQPTDHEWTILETSKSRDVSRDEKTEKVNEDGRQPVRNGKVTQTTFRRVSTFKRKVPIVST